MREVNTGYILRYFHATGASMIFLVLYIHLFRGLYFSSYSYLTKTWISGVIIYYLSIVTCFLGYILPWGQMSFWAATVITNLLTFIPNLVPWLLGGYYVDVPTCQRFFILHFILPFVVMIIAIYHIFFLHVQGSSNPVGMDHYYKVPFFPHFLIADYKGLVVLLLLFCLQSYFGLIEISHPDNSVVVDRYITPLQIVPEWYFLALYTILKIIPNKVGGLLLLVTSQITYLLYSEIRFFNKLIYLKNISINRDIIKYVVWYIIVFQMLTYLGALLPLQIYLKYGKNLVNIYLLLGFIKFSKYKQL